MELSASTASGKKNKTRLRGPKVRGCYSCSQRRIDCDRTSPCCLKCRKKGIECFGLPGARYRFVSKSGSSVGAATKDPSRHTSNEPRAVDPNECPGSSAEEFCLKTALEFDISEQFSARTSDSIDVTTLFSVGISLPQVSHWSWPLDLIPDPAFLDPFLPIFPTLYAPVDDMDLQMSDVQLGSIQVPDSDTHDVEDMASFIGLRRSQGSAFDPVIDHLTSVERFFLSYFSRHVAPVMVVIDEKFNGYRDLVLPLTESVPHVRNAVIAAGAHHFALKTYFSTRVAQMYSTKAIDQLLRRYEAGTSTPLVDNTSIASLVVLLICNMITGRDNFKTLFSTLRCSLIARGEQTIAKDALGLFLLQQTQKMQLYAYPQLSEEEGVEWLSIRLTHSLDFLHAAKRDYPDQGENITRIISLVERACDIYLHRALNDVETDLTVNIVEDFRATAEKLPPGAKGAHVLVWAYFVVGAESSTWEHRLFFINKLQLLYVTTGFANTLSALQLLKKMWQKHEEKRWTYCLGINSETFIM